MLPQPDDRTLSRYLASVADTIGGIDTAALEASARARLDECATVVRRVAQHLDEDRAGVLEFAGEIAALRANNAALLDGNAPAGEAGAPRALDAAEVERYLQAHPMGGAGTQVTAARLLAGGRCKLTAIVDQIGAAGLPGSFILRQDWQGGATDTTVGEEFDLLSRVHAAAIRAPRPLMIERDHSGVGQPFMLVERVDGAAVGSLFTPPHSRTLAEQLAVQLGRLHAIAPEGFGDPGVVRTERPATIARELEEFRQAHAAIGIRSAIVDSALDWLGAHAKQAGGAVSLTHNDLGFHNFLVSGEELTAILDWELARLGHPAEDLGYVRLFVEQMMPWDDFVALYREAGGPEVGNSELAFHSIWSAVRLYGLIMRARAAIAMGVVNDIEITFACADNLMLLLEKLGEWLERELTEQEG